VGFKITGNGGVTIKVRKDNKKMLFSRLNLVKKIDLLDLLLIGCVLHYQFKLILLMIQHFGKPLFLKQ